MKQMSRLKPILDLISHYKYAITITICVLLVGFVDENSFMRRTQLEMQISDLESEIEKYNAQNEANMKQLKALGQGPDAVEKIARERYFMHTDDEDIFVLSDDPKPDNENTDNDETAE